MRKRILATLLALVFIAPALSARQQPPPQQPPPDAAGQEETVRIGASAVHVDVIVTDKSGRRVTGLTASDFQVLDEKQPVAIDYFAAIEGSRLSRPAGTGGQPDADAAQRSTLLRPYPGRHIALVVDDTTMTNDNFIRTRKALTDYVNNRLGPSDMAAVISVGGRMGTSQQFTNDKQRLLAAINRLTAPTNRTQMARGQIDMTYQEAQRINAGDRTVLEAVARRASASSLANQGSSGTLADNGRVGGGGMTPIGSAGGDDEGTGASEAGLMRARVRNAAQTRVQEIAADTRNTALALSSLFKGMADLPGRKVVLLLSESFVTLGGTTEDQTNQMNQLIEQARRGGISVYALDAGGLRTTSSQASEQLTGVDILANNLAGSATMSEFEKLSAARMVAYGTGGSVIANTNDITGGLDRAVEDSSSYYVVGFRPAALDNKFHRLAVTVKGKPDLIVRTRRGYLAVNQETVRGTGAELAAALLSPVPVLDLPVEVVARVVPAGGGQSVQLGFHVGRNYLSLPAEGSADQTAAYELVAAVFAAGKDEPEGGVKRSFAFDLSKPEERQKLAASGFTFVPQPMTFAPGQYQVRVVMREKTSGAVGSSYQFFEVPNLADRKAVSASSLLLSEAGKTEFSGANAFKPNSEIDIRYVLYNAPKDPNDVTQRVRLVDAKGTVMMESPLAIAPPPAGQTVAPQGTRLKVPPRRGRYSIIFFVQDKDKKGKIDIERRADFVVE
ncbi:MAG: VWA domain-containing protein [Acidobacteria bacterium]|nr:VWA domain-containing protein [Acidobacteriota bacterium]MCA1619771.1 VWA domain-containing protein [Acidobacteriota bacterium]